MSELMQSTEMPHESEEAQSHEDAAPMSEIEIGSMFDEPEVEPEVETPAPVETPAEEPPAEPEIHAPGTWSESEKEEFAALPRTMQEKIVAREKERDAYLTRKTKEIADKSRSVQSLEALGEALRNDPGLKAHLAAYQKQQAAVEAPSDPIDRIAWEAEQRAVAKVNEQLGPIIQQLQQHNRVQETLFAVKQDEHHKEVYAEIEKLLKAMPPEDAKMTYQRLDTDPDYFARTYDHYRAQVIARPKVATPQAPTAPTPVDRKTKAPLLEIPGAEQPDTSKKKRFSDLKSRAYTGDTAALGALFDF